MDEHHQPQPPRVLAVEYIAGALAERLEADPGFALADAQRINEHEGWDLDFPDQDDEWIPWAHWPRVRLAPLDLDQAWDQARVLLALWEPTSTLEDAAPGPRDRVRRETESP